MKKAYSTPEADVINLQAIENIALVIDPKEARDNGSSSGGIGDNGSVGDYTPGEY